MSHALSKRIILSPDQLRRLLGRDRELTNSTDIARMDALKAATRRASAVGPAQAYAQYRSSQERHLNQAAKERNAPLELVVSDPESQKRSEGKLLPSEAKLLPDLMDFEEPEQQQQWQVRGKTGSESEDADDIEDFATPIATPIASPSATPSSSARKAPKRLHTVKRIQTVKRRIITHSPSSQKFSPLKTRGARAKQGKSIQQWLQYGKI